MVAEDEVALAVEEGWETRGDGEEAAAVERWWGGRRGWGGITTDGPFAETKEVIAGYPRVTPGD